MTDLAELFRSVLDGAIGKLEAQRVEVFTFAFYHDHESNAVEVCADTEAASNRLVRAQNRFNARHFQSALERGSLEELALWQANVGRSLSLGDFAFVGLSRRRLPSRTPDDLHLQMLRAVRDVEDRVCALAPDRDRVLFACSSAIAEVGFVWASPGTDGPDPFEAANAVAEEVLRSLRTDLER